MNVLIEEGQYFEHNIKCCYQYLLTLYAEKEDEIDSDLCEGLHRGTDQRV